MEWSWLESVSLNQQKLVEQLVQGREMANQLQRCINGDVGSVEDLARKILGSFANTIRILNGNQEVHEELISHIQAKTVTASSSATAPIPACADNALDDDAVRPKDSNEESYNRTETLKNHRSCYKTRETWTKDTLDLVDDGHSWRKYGQKTIRSTRYPRNYFRCSYKFEQGCKAIKHVDWIKDKPQLFRTTYYGNHTCIDHHRAPELMLNCSSTQDSAKNMIRFDNTNEFTCKQEHPFFSSFTSIKQESVKEDEMITPISDDDHATLHNQSSCDYVMSSNPGVFESSGPIDLFSTTITYDQDDVISRIKVAYFDCEEDFPYEF